MSDHAFREAMQVLPAQPVQGRFYRAVEGEKLDVLDTRRSLEGGGRYNPPGEFGALYCSDRELAPVEEKKAEGEDGSVRVVPLEVALARVLDLTRPAVLARLGVREEDLTGGDHSLTRELGRAARACRFEGLLVPSSVVDCRNLAVFVDCLEIGSRVSAAEQESRRKAT